MKKFLLCLFSSFLILSSCGSETEQIDETGNADQAFYFTYKTAEFEIEVPDQWEVLDSFTSEYPNELRAAFKNNVQNSVFTANVTVLREENLEKETSYDWAQRKLADHKDTLLNYSLTAQEIVNLNVDGSESKTMLSTFEGKNGASGPTLTFQQVTLTKGEKAWTVTASYRSGEDEFTVNELETMLRSFTLN